jgi:glyoxylase-like metal-dependent hydrolase (beta-lactamase superfamily II)
MEVYNVTADAETFTCNAYLAVGERTTLVDAGAWSGVVDRIRGHTDTLDAVVLTHQHGDHVQQLGGVLDAFDAELAAFGDEHCEVLYTPGHADDHISLVSAASLFSGDVVVHNDGAFDDGSFGRTDRPGQSRNRLVESIQRLLDRLPDGVESMYSGHGDVFHGDVRTIVERALERAQRHEPKYPE